MNDGKLLALAAALTWVMIITAAMLRTHGSLVLLLGNRDNLAPPSPLADRADRAAKNMIENLIVFTAAYLGAKAAGASATMVERGAEIFVVARLLYFGLYLAGVKVVRTVAWAAGVAATALLVAGALGA